MLTSFQSARCPRGHFRHRACGRNCTDSAACCGIGQSVRRAAECWRGSSEAPKGRSGLMADFLLEIGTEEIPARMLTSASLDLGKRVVELLVRESLFNVEKTLATIAPESTGLGFPVCATPRRLALVVPGIEATQPDVTEQLTGPATKVAYQDGQPTPAAHAFAKKAGVDVSLLQKWATPKGQ